MSDSTETICVCGCDKTYYNEHTDNFYCISCLHGRGEEYYLEQMYGLIKKRMDDKNKREKELSDMMTISLRDDSETRSVISKYQKGWGLLRFGKGSDLSISLHDMYESLFRKLGAGKVICPWMKDDESITINVNVTIPVVIKKEHKK